jgi:hypothetical protein
MRDEQLLSRRGALQRLAVGLIAGSCAAAWVTGQQGRDEGQERKEGADGGKPCDVTSTAMLFDDVYGQHHVPSGFPERPERLTAIREKLGEVKGFKRLGLGEVDSAATLGWIEKVHHGNGTQATFYENPTVLYFSVHQWPFYPGTGARKGLNS